MKILKYVFNLIIFIILPIIAILYVNNTNKNSDNSLKHINEKIQHGIVLVSNENTFNKNCSIETCKEIVEKIGNLQNYSKNIIDITKSNNNQNNKYYSTILNTYILYNQYLNRLQNETKLGNFVKIKYINELQESYFIDIKKYKKIKVIDVANFLFLVITYYIFLII